MDVSALGLHTARAVGRSFFEPASGDRDRSEVETERKWFDCISATSGSAVVAANWEIARHATAVRTDDHWIAFIGPPASDDDNEDIARFRDDADLAVESDGVSMTELVELVAEAWKQWLTELD